MMRCASFTPSSTSKSAGSEDGVNRAGGFVDGEAERDQSVDDRFDLLLGGALLHDD